MAASTIYVTPAGAGDKSGSSWANAMGLAEWETDIEGSAEAGDIYYVAGGTYTLTGAWSTALAGTAASPISVIGVKSGTTNEPLTISDYADGTDRPLIAASSNSFSFTGNYWKFGNLRVTTTAQYGFRVSGFSLIYNCYSYNSSATSNYYAFINSSGYYSSFIDCEAISTNGTAIYAPTAIMVNCYAHDSAIGIDNSSDGVIVGCVINTCTTGVSLTTSRKAFMFGNTIYDCTTGITGTTAYDSVFINNIISGCTTGASWTTEEKSNYWNYNCWNNTTDVTNVTKGNNGITADPQFMDAANGDFRLKPTSPCLNTGKPTLGSGYTSIGTWQRKTLLG